MGLVSIKKPQVAGEPMRALFQLESKEEKEIYQQLLDCEGGTKCTACGEIIKPKLADCFVEVENPMSSSIFGDSAIIGSFLTKCHICGKDIKPNVASFADVSCFKSINDIVMKARAAQRRQQRK